jgi:O-antigen/teichoic acid export membrane protein
VALSPNIGTGSGRSRKTLPMRLLRRNILTTYAVYGATVVSGLVLTPVIVRSLGLEQYGLWSFVAALTTYLGLLDFGLGPTVVRHGAEYRGRRAPEETNALVSAGLVVYGVIGALTVAVGGALSWVVPDLLELEDDLVWPARLAAFLVVAGLVVRFPLGLFWNLLVAQQRYDVVNASALASIALYALLVLTLVAGSDDVVVLAAVALAATVLRLMLPLAWLRRELPFLRPRLALVTRERLRGLLAFSWHNFLIHLSAKVVFAADVVVVGILLGAEAAAFYAIPAKLFTLAFGVGTGATQVLYPAFAELEGAEEPARQRAYLRAGLRAGMALMLLFAVPLILIPDLLIRAWIGPGYGPSTSVMVLLGIALVVHQPIQLLTQYLVARRLQAPLARVLVAVVVANVVLSVALALLVGLWGVAAATVATELVALALVPRLVARSSGLGARELARLPLRPVVPALAVGLAVFLPVRALGLDDLLSLTPVGAIWVVAFALAVWRLGLSAAERGAMGRGLGLARERPALASSAPDALS